MATTMRTADVGGHLAAKLFEGLNPDVDYMPGNPFNLACTSGVIVTDIHPLKLVYPEGWYYAKGYFRNKFNTTSGSYEEIPMLNRDGLPWD